MLTERGTMFGYHDLIVDFRGIPEMKKIGFPGRYGYYPFSATAQPEFGRYRRTTRHD